ncbi:MAG: hypothetical protein ABIG39_02765 [Candidatus Micrarchaeota archaeon]
MHRRILESYCVPSYAHPKSATNGLADMIRYCKWKDKHGVPKSE